MHRGYIAVRYRAGLSGPEKWFPNLAEARAWINEGAEGGYWVELL